MNTKKKCCGKILILGRANTGKSTLFNKLLEKKLSIVSKKKNTTIKNIIGAKISLNIKYIFIDTPGIYSSNETYLKRINKNIQHVQLILFIVEKTIWTTYDEEIYKYIKNKNVPIIIIINKIDLCKNKQILLPYINFIQKKINPVSIFPISAKKDYQFSILLNNIKKFLPETNYINKKNIENIKSNKYMYTELIRETLFHYLNKEIPYKIYVKMCKLYVLPNKEKIIYVNIITSNKNYKKIIIGKNGNKIKCISIMSRKKIEDFFKEKTHVILKIVFFKNV
ncbi:GTPase Era [Buchnera aphidicola]|uniref:GTPase Era n=1 Tax=Buchnera aphidicola (Anoecia oenotherae) TaxID=1241833 RepID=A0A4D6Y0E8_9GAMM|nr:GTPase Era [Buchnera aphidicola]QCI19331.1 GTPase Era [Buchnera aphidicola (Anoecia oenotherae)]